MPKEETKREIKSDLTGLGMLTFAILSFASLLIAKIDGQYLTGEAIGAIGQFIVRVMTGLWGTGKFIFPVLFAYWSVKVIQKSPNLWRLIASTFTFFCILLTLLHLPMIQDASQFSTVVRSGFEGQGGGLIGALTGFGLYFFFGRIGSYIVLIAAGLLSLVLLDNRSFGDVVKNVKRRVFGFFALVKEKLENFIFEEVEIEESDETDFSSQDKLEKDIPIIVDHSGNAGLENPGESLDKAGRTRKPFLDDTEHEEIPPEKDNLFKNDFDSHRDFILPSINILQKSMQLKKSRIDKDITDRIKLLEQTLASFGVEVKVTQVSCGPAITRYELQPAKGVKVSRIVNLADDIALSLAAPDVRIEAPIPGKAALGIEVPNKEIAMVFFRDVLESREYSASRHPLSVALGKDIAGTTVVANLRDMPHLLIAGATGSGKSVCMNTLIASLLFRNTPSELKLMIIDPKMVELSNYNGIPHLLCPVVTEPKKAATALRWMVREMEKRYEDFAKYGVRDIQRCNDLAEKREDLEKLPYIVVLIDELADMMMVAPTDVEDCICRLAQMARAAGIHLVVATQRPSVDVITGLIKANIPSRIAFAVSSQTDSRTILDVGGAEKLLGRGDMLFHPVGAAKPVRIQGAYISDNEVEALVRFLRSQATPDYENDLLGSQPEDTGFEEEAEDELLPKAVNLCLEHGHASISLLQRRLHIGYTRAARLIDQMERKGIIGPYEGSKPRSILTGWEQYRGPGKEDSE